jgi:RNA polymerase sigma-70 factor, ECF subfamily
MYAIADQSAFPHPRLAAPFRKVAALKMRTGPIAAHEVDIGEQMVPHLGRMWRYALVLSRQRDVAEDLVQAACVRGIERAGQFRPGTRLDRWLFSILHSIWIDEVRSRRVRLGQGFVEADTALVLDGEHDVQTRVDANQVLRQIDALPEAQRTAVFLAYVEGYSYREIADVLSIPIGTVMSRLASGRAKLSGEPSPGNQPRLEKGRQ